MRHRRLSASLARVVIVALVLTLASSVAGCGGRTKVMTAQKSIVYRERLYNVSVVREVSPVQEVTLPDDSVRDLERLDDRAVRDLFGEYDRLRARFVIMLDDTALIYFQGPVTSARELSRIQDRFRSALGRIQRFMADGKQTQLELS